MPLREAASPQSHTRRQTNHGRQAHGPASSIQRPPQAQKLSKGAQKRETGKDKEETIALLATEPGRTGCSQTRGCRDKQPQRRGSRFRVLQKAQIREAGGRLVQASFACPGERGTEQLAVLPELCSGVTAPETPGGAGMATVQILRPPQTCPSETLQQEPPSCISNKLPLVTDTHRCLRTTSQDPSLAFPVTLTSMRKRTLPQAVGYAALHLAGFRGQGEKAGSIIILLFPP